MGWTVVFHDIFEAEFAVLPEEVQDALLVSAGLLQARGPQLGRPHVDTLNGSGYANMKELRFSADDGVWRVAFAFDPKRQAVLLVAGAKQGVAGRKFYQDLIRRADQRYADHLNRQSGGKA